MWLLVNKAEVNARFDSQRIDLNSALRQEVLLFATHGIRKSVYIDILKNEDATSTVITVMFYNKSFIITSQTTSLNLRSA